MRGLALVAAFGLAACGDATKAPRQDASIDSASDTSVDATADTSVDATADTSVDAASDASESADHAPDPFQCATVTPIILSSPTVTAGVAAPGQKATLTITMTDTDPNGYVSYPGIILTTSTPGITFFGDLGPPGSLIEGKMSKPVDFMLTFDASIPSGTEAAFLARPYGWGHSAPDCPNVSVLSFSLAVR